jgi:hypothetical protein
MLQIRPVWLSRNKAKGKWEQVQGKVLSNLGGWQKLKAVNKRFRALWIGCSSPVWILSAAPPLPLTSAQLLCSSNQGRARWVSVSDYEAEKRKPLWMGRGGVFPLLFPPTFLGFLFLSRSLSSFLPTITDKCLKNTVAYYMIFWVVFFFFFAVLGTQPKALTQSKAPIVCS